MRRQYFAQKKALQEKHGKTEAAGAKALAQVEGKAAAALAKKATARQISAVRAAAWWEKFHWFVSTEGYLVLAAKDAQQAELLATRCAP